MEIKTQQETLVSLYNEQLELVLNRRASLRMLEKLAPEKVLNRRLNEQTMQIEEITVKSRKMEIEEALELEELRLSEYEQMLKEEEEKASQVGTKAKTGVETE